MAQKVRTILDIKNQSVERKLFTMHFEIVTQLFDLMESSHNLFLFNWTLK